VFTLVTFLFTSTALAQKSPSLPPIPEQPSTLPVFARSRPSAPQECDRFFVYQKKKILCDSNLGKDAEALRPILSQVPEAVSYLDKYQRRRRQLKTSAYFGTVGLALLLTGLLAPKISNQPNTQQTIKNVSKIGGLGFLTATGIFGIIILSTNEANLGQAVQIYNQKRPNDPIELQFSTGILF
jgi:hypothetical protein